MLQVDGSTILVYQNSWDDENPSEFCPGSLTMFEADFSASVAESLTGRESEIGHDRQTNRAHLDPRGWQGSLSETWMKIPGKMINFMGKTPDFHGKNPERFLQMFPWINND